MGNSPEDAVESIRIGIEPSGVSGDGRASLTGLAICIGPMLSRELEEALKEKIDLNKATMTQVWDMLPTTGTPQQRNITMRSRMLIDVMGAVAETKFLGRADALFLFMSYTCENDRTDFTRCCRILGIPPDQVDAMRDKFLTHAQSLLGGASVWSAIKVIAGRLRATMSGTEVARLAWPTLIADSDAIAMALPPD